MSKIQLHFQVIKDASKIFETDSNFHLSDILLPLVKGSDATIRGNPQEAVVLIASPILNKHMKLSDLELQAGDFLLLYYPERENPKLILHHPSESPDDGWPVVSDKALIGRSSTGIDPEVDLNSASEKIRPTITSVSSEQAILFQEDGTWFIRLHPNGRVRMYVDRQQLDQGERIPLRDGSVLSFGLNLDKPRFQLICRILAN